MTEYMRLKSASEAMMPENKRRVILDNGEIKDFIELQVGDIFQILNPDGNIELMKYEGKVVSWLECKSKPYLNDQQRPTVKADHLNTPPNLR